jgi:hypothetical protein
MTMASPQTSIDTPPTASAYGNPWASQRSPSTLASFIFYWIFRFSSEVDSFLYCRFLASWHSFLLQVSPAGFTAEVLTRPTGRGFYIVSFLYCLLAAAPHTGRSKRGSVVVDHSLRLVTALARTSTPIPTVYLLLYYTVLYNLPFTFISNNRCVS